MQEPLNWSSLGLLLLSAVAEASGNFAHKTRIH